MSRDSMATTPAAFILAHASASEPPVSIARQASVTTTASKPAARASMADENHARETTFAQISGEPGSRAAVRLAESRVAVDVVPVTLTDDEFRLGYGKQRRELRAG